ncbi:MAG: site-2 protease family protein [Oscillospiraceae bacterium]|nr:site-2 protease family protein [Oscillospiraceae bacterium]
MSGFISALIIILVLGVLITVHELGHYVAARLSGIRVREFAIGMGPTFFRRQKKNQNGEPAGTVFSLRVFPIGGFCDMGEDEENDDPAHFRNKPARYRAFVLISGSMMNFVIGFLFFLALYLSMPAIRMPDIYSLDPEFPYAGQIQVGDRFHSINGRRIYNLNDFYLFLDRDADKPYTFVMERDGTRFTVENATRQLEDGTRFGFVVIGWEELTFLNSVKHAASSTVSFVRLVWMSLGDLISGSAGAGDLVGPVGLGSVVNDVISDEANRVADMVRMLLQLSGLVAVNLAVVNLLPIPALDGGRIIFLLFSVLLVKLRGKPLNSKIEGYIHGVTMILLFALMIFIFFNDIRRLVGF